MSRFSEGFKFHPAEILGFKMRENLQDWLDLRKPEKIKIKLDKMTFAGSCTVLPHHNPYRSGTKIASKDFFLFFKTIRLAGPPIKGASFCHLHGGKTVLPFFSKHYGEKTVTGQYCLQGNILCNILLQTVAAGKTLLL